MIKKYAARWDKYKFQSSKSILKYLASVNTMAMTYELSRTQSVFAQRPHKL